jgi:hypothetical protein
MPRCAPHQLAFLKGTAAAHSASNGGAGVSTETAPRNLGWRGEIDNPARLVGHLHAPHIETKYASISPHRPSHGKWEAASPFQPRATATLSLFLCSTPTPFPLSQTSDGTRAQPPILGQQQHGNGRVSTPKPVNLNSRGTPATQP